MRNIKLVVLVILLLGSAFAVSAQIQPRFKNSSGFLRSSLEEKLTAKEKRPLLNYLDEGRIIADQAMKLLADAKYDEFYKSTSKVFQSQYSQEQFRQIIQAFEKTSGKIVSYEYRNQALELPAGVALSYDLSKATSDTHYAIRLSKVEGEGFFTDIETTIENGKHVISFITTQTYGANIPPWLLKSSVMTTQKK